MRAYIEMAYILVIYIPLSIEIIIKLFLVWLLEYPSSGYIGDDHKDNGATSMIITRSLLVQMGSIRLQMKAIGGVCQIMNVFLWICYHFFIHSKITVFGEQNLGQICCCIILQSVLIEQTSTPEKCNRRSWAIPETILKIIKKKIIVIINIK